MEDFKNYLIYLKQSLDNIKNYENIHFVLGNESCDLDSSVSALILAYFLYKINASNSSINCNCPIPDNAIIIPIQNVPKENFIYRTDNCYLFKQIGLPLDLLIYRDELNFEEIVNQKKVTTTLVDHHVLSENDRFLESTVIQIFDHRPRDPTFKWDENDVEITIKNVGSCATLISEKVLADNILFHELGFLLYATIVYDTQALSAESGRAKELDHQITNMLENKFNFTDDRKTLFDKLWKAHNDVSHLTPKQILMKDLKMVENIPVPGLPMLVEDFLKLEGTYNAVKNLALESNLVVLIGLDASNDVRRDVAIFSNNFGEKLRDMLMEMLVNSQKYKGYDFDFKQVQINYDDVQCFRQNNIKLSRKQIIPLIIDAVNNCN